MQQWEKKLAMSILARNWLLHSLWTNSDDLCLLYCRVGPQKKAVLNPTMKSPLMEATVILSDVASDSDVFLELQSPEIIWPLENAKGPLPLHAVTKSRQDTGVRLDS